MKTQQERGIVLNNGTILKKGEKYYRKDWIEDTYATILCIHKNKLFCELNRANVVGTYNLEEAWLPYTEPKEEPKPLTDYKKWYVLEDNLIDVVYAKTKEEIIKSLINIKAVYSETEAIELGLTL